MKNSTSNQSYFIIAFDTNKGTRFIDNEDSIHGTSFESDAKPFDTRQDAQAFIDASGYVCWIVEYSEADGL